MKNKILISFILFIVILSIFNFCFASSELKFSDGNIYRLPDFNSYVKDKEYVIIYGKNKNVGVKFVLLPYESSTHCVRLQGDAPSK